MAPMWIKKRTIFPAAIICLTVPLIACAAEPQAERIADLPDPAAIILVATSLDCRHEAMIVSKNASNSLWFDGKQLLNTPDTLRSLLLSPDGHHVACVQSSATQTRVVIDGAAAGAYDEIGQTADSLSFSADGNHFACTARKANQWFIVLDRKETLAGDSLETLEEAIECLQRRLRLLQPLRFLPEKLLVVVRDHRRAGAGRHDHILRIS